MKSWWLVLVFALGACSGSSSKEDSGCVSPQLYLSSEDSSQQLWSCDPPEGWIAVDQLAIVSPPSVNWTYETGLFLTENWDDIIIDSGGDWSTYNLSSWDTGVPVNSTTTSPSTTPPTPYDSSNWTSGWITTTSTGHTGSPSWTTTSVPTGGSGSWSTHTYLHSGGETGAVSNETNDTSSVPTEPVTSETNDTSSVPTEPVTSETNDTSFAHTGVLVQDTSTSVHTGSDTATTDTGSESN